MFKSYIDPTERREADKKLPRLMLEGLLLGGSGLGVLALIFEVAADAFSVAAYQTLLAIDGASGHHRIAIYAFIVLSVLLFLGIVPAYKAGAYLRPNAGGSGPLVEAIGPPRMKWLSWIGTSLFFLDAILTIIISSISAADATMLLYPEAAPYRILLAELFAFFIMAVLVALGPKRAVPLFLIGGGAFTIFTIGALSVVGAAAAGNPEWSFIAEGIVSRLEANGVVEHVVRAQQETAALSTGMFLSLFFRSMSSAMLGFSGYEVIPASGKHAARPKWKVINTTLTMAAIFLIGTGVFQLFSASQWEIPATEGYSTLLIEYEIVAAQIFGAGVSENVIPSETDYELAEEVLSHSAEKEGEAHSQDLDTIARNIAIGRAAESATEGTVGGSLLLLAGVLLAIILLLAQGGGYVGGAAVAANAARLGRLPRFFADDRIGIAVIWGISAILIPIVRTVTIVESYYAFGFVSAFAITSTTVFFVRDGALLDRGIEPGSAEARSLRFAGLRGMIASYFMAIVLITQKASALPAIIIGGIILTLLQIFVSNGGFRRKADEVKLPVYGHGKQPDYEDGRQRAFDRAKQRGMVDAVNELTHDTRFMGRFNVGPRRVTRLVCYLYGLDPQLFEHDDHHHDRIEEPSLALEASYEAGYARKDEVAAAIESYSNFGIFTFINNYHINWVSEEHGRTREVVQQAMLDILFPQAEHDEIWRKFCAYEPMVQPEPIWQFSRSRYLWAKDQWPNLSDRITTIWTLQEFGLLPDDIDVETVISVADNKQQMRVKVPTKKSADSDKTVVEKQEVDGEE